MLTQEIDPEVQALIDADWEEGEGLIEDARAYALDLLATAIPPHGIFTY